MTAFDLQEQEQLEELKAFWAKWGSSIIIVVVVGVGTYLGMHGWQYWQKSRASAAADAYSLVETAFKDKDAAKTRAAADAMVAAYAGSALSSRAMLLSAKAAFDAKDLPGAKKALEWVVANAKEEAMADTANLRLAAVLVDMKDLDGALAILKTSKTPAFVPLFADARGDVLAMKGDVAGAKAAYQEALAKLEKDAPVKKLVDIKLSALGA